MQRKYANKAKLGWKYICLNYVWNFFFLTSRAIPTILTQYNHSIAELKKKRRIYIYVFGQHGSLNHSLKQWTWLLIKNKFTAYHCIRANKVLQLGAFKIGIKFTKICKVESFPMCWYWKISLSCYVAQILVDIAVKPRPSYKFLGKQVDLAAMTSSERTNEQPWLF